MDGGRGLPTVRTCGVCLRPMRSKILKQPVERSDGSVVWREVKDEKTGRKVWYVAHSEDGDDERCATLRSKPHLMRVWDGHRWRTHDHSSCTWRGVKV